MGKRAQLFYAARDCINVLECPKPNEILYENDLGLCMIFLTRQKLMNVAHKIINDIYKRNDITMYECKSNLLRFYKLNKLHTFQLKKYNQIHFIDNENVNVNVNVNVNTQYLQNISYMVTQISKS